MIDHHRYQTLKPHRISYFLVMLVCVSLVAIGAYSALTMEHAGHIITGMNNHVVWGLPHVFAVGLIVTASGALNGASMASVFAVAIYKPIARLSVIFAMSLLVGGLLVLVLDLGRPDRLIIAMTTYNFRSIFAWNIFLYTGFLVLGSIYLWMMMEKRFNKNVATIGRLAFAWRIVLTTGTGCIFGFLVGRNALDSALLAPMFVALSLVMGTSALLLVIVLLDRWQGLLSNELIRSLSKMLVWFLLALLYFSVVHHLTNLYATEHLQIEKHTLVGQHAALFWLGHVMVGVILPILVISFLEERLGSRKQLIISAGLSLLGGLALLYVVIVGSQSTPQVLFPGKTVLASTFGDAGFPEYSPSVWEWGLGLGGVALAVLLCLLVLRVLPLLPVLRTIEGESA